MTYLHKKLIGRIGADPDSVVEDVLRLASAARRLTELYPGSRGNPSDEDLLAWMELGAASNIFLPEDGAPIDGNGKSDSAGSPASVPVENGGKIGLRDIGEMDLDSMNDANVPVVCFLLEPDDENRMWTWTARNFMPRKERCGGSWKLEAATKEEIMEALQKHVIPLYEAALSNLKEHGTNYYWERKED